jgi:uncharacterized SAM-binding protein YcdF (DUF218 family)
MISGGRTDGNMRVQRRLGTTRSFFVDQGVNPADLILEDRSRTTHENALECAKLLHERDVRQIILITDAKHMLRAKLCFEKEGFQVIPAPCNFVTAQFQNRWENYLPSPQGAARFQEAFHEWLGIVYYRLRGWL